MTIQNDNLSVFIPLLEFFSCILGEKSEVVLHRIFKEDGKYYSEIISIYNSISGRSIGSPGTDLLYNIINSGEYRTKNFVANYTGKASNGKLLRSSTFFITNTERDIIGMICVNSDVSPEQEVEAKLNAALQAIQTYLYQDKFALDDCVKENLYISSASIVDSVLADLLGEKHPNFKHISKTKKLEIVAALYKAGYFELKDAIADLAARMGMATTSIYKYLQQVKEGQLK